MDKFWYKRIKGEIRLMIESENKRKEVNNYVESC